MLLNGCSHGDDDNLAVAEYSATFPYGYDFMLDLAQNVINMDLGEGLQRVAVQKIAADEFNELLDEVKAAGNQLRNCPQVAEENGVLIIAGMSEILHVPIQIALYNQTDIIRIFTTYNDVFKDNGDNALTKYICTMEIRAYCEDAERRVRAELAGK
ncbi:hypothetical protein [uncultured Ruminococcus sp.]|uniref:hypothetical protein n=1 Tax=uncultured Ruminococcus sp. TaxID=165186 RepID=UPI0025F60749|nr:hypothetical protein [uncultured Ruminococcus sp.]